MKVMKSAHCVPVQDACTCCVKPTKHCPTNCCNKLISIHQPCRATNNYFYPVRNFTALEAFIADI